MDTQHGPLVNAGKSLAQALGMRDFQRFSVCSIVFGPSLFAGSEPTPSAPFQLIMKHELQVALSKAAVLTLL